MTSTDPWVAWLESELGVAESPPGSNRTPVGAEFGWNGVAWCAETQSLAAYHAFGRRILWTAGVANAAASARAGENGMQWLGPDTEVRVGDLPCFDWAGNGDPGDMHISGIVNPGTQDKFETIGGNENDRVMRQWRDRSAVFGFIRLPFDDVGLAPVTPRRTEELTMAFIQLVTCNQHSDAQLHNVVFKAMDNYWRYPIPEGTTADELAAYQGLWGAVVDLPQHLFDALVPMDVIYQGALR